MAETKTGTENKGSTENKSGTENKGSNPGTTPETTPGTNPGNLFGENKGGTTPPPSNAPTTNAEPTPLTSKAKGAKDAKYKHEAKERVDPRSLYEGADDTNDNKSNLSDGKELTERDEEAILRQQRREREHLEDTQGLAPIEPDASKPTPEDRKNLKNSTEAERTARKDKV